MVRRAGFGFDGNLQIDEFRRARPLARCDLGCMRAAVRRRLLDAANIWVTNVVIFALWFWSLDRGGPAARGIISEAKKRFPVYPTTNGCQPRTVHRLVTRIYRLPVSCFYKRNGFFSG
jgi:hypothetical protein